MPKILFVEDDPFIAEIYEKKFSTSGFDVVHAVTGKAVLREVRQQKFDLILLDLVLPEMNGTEVLRELRTNPDYSQDLKIIIFSNLSSAEDREQTLSLGANGFISKMEFSPEEVVAEIKRFLYQWSEQGKNLERSQNGGSSVVSKGKTILFIENESVFVEMFGKRLKDEGYDVVTETNGANALKVALDRPFDMIISDIMLPGMDGREVIQTLKKAPHTKDLPMFVLSASLEDEHLKELEKSGLVERAFLKTETTPSQLVNMVNEYFQDQPSSQ